jgi:hypothetical protein
MGKVSVPKELFSLQNDYWILRETLPGVFELVSKVKPSCGLAGCTSKELATLEGLVFELQRHLREVKQ